MTKRSPFKYFKTSPAIIRLAVMFYIRSALSLRNVKDLLHERGVDVSHETLRFWWHRFGPDVRLRDPKASHRWHEIKLQELSYRIDDRQFFFDCFRRKYK